MVKVIRLSRYKFEKDKTQHNITFSVSAFFGNDEALINERVRIMTTLIETLYPNTITITHIGPSARHLTIYEQSLLPLGLAKRMDALSDGDEIALDQLKDVMLYCYGSGLEVELDILDIKNQHSTAAINKDVWGYHFIYGTPETFSEEYLSTIKKKLKDCAFDGSFRKTLK